MKNYILGKKYEFETNEGWMADIFVQVLELFHIEIEDAYIPSFLEYSQIEFRATKKQFNQIDYVFERYLKELGRRKAYYALY